MSKEIEGANLNAAFHWSDDGNYVVLEEKTADNLLKK